MERGGEQPRGVWQKPQDHRSRRELRGRGETRAQVRSIPSKPGAVAGEESVSRSPPGRCPSPFAPLILFALERSEQRPGEPPATALPPARPRTAPLLSPDGTAAPGTDLRRGEQESGAGASLRLPRHQGRASRGQQCRDAEACGAVSQPTGVPGAAFAGSLPDGAALRLQEALNCLGPLLGSFQLGSSLSVPDHRVRPRKLPGQEDGVHFGLSKHHGMWLRQHPLPEGGMWRVSTQLPVEGVLSQAGWLGQGYPSVEWDQLPPLCLAGAKHHSQGKPGMGGSHPARAEQPAPGSTDTERGPEDSGNTFGITQNCLRQCWNSQVWSCPRMQ